MKAQLLERMKIRYEWEGGRLKKAKDISRDGL